MILYLDTSAFLKLYLEESRSDAVRGLVARAAAIYTHLIAYAEMRAALAPGGPHETHARVRPDLPGPSLRG